MSTSDNRRNAMGGEHLISLFDSITDTIPKQKGGQLEDLLKACLNTNFITKALVPCWSPAIFKKSAERNDSGVEVVYTLAYDFDKRVPSKFPSNWKNIVHTTWSHTKDIPKYRLIIPLKKPVPAKYFRVIYNLAAEFFDVNAAMDESCSNPSRVFFLPSNNATFTTIDGPVFDWIEELVSSGKRHVVFTKIAGYIAKYSNDINEVTDALELLNFQIDEPMSEKEIENIVKSSKKWIEKDAPKRIEKLPPTQRLLELARSKPELLQWKFSYNNWRYRTEISFRGMPATHVDDGDILKFRYALIIASGLEVSKDKAWEVLSQLAKENLTNPAADYILSLGASPAAEPDPERVFTLVEGAEWLPLHKTMFKKWFIGAVARVLVAHESLNKRAAKMDNILVVPGIQGAGKSTFFENLVPDPDWFTSSIPSFSRDKHVLELIKDKWIVETDELEKIYKRSDEIEAKSFLSVRFDHYRPPYEREAKIYPRRCAFAATTNDSRFLRDLTGNRRYWVMPETACVETSYIADNKDLWWAWALKEFRAGTKWWLDAPDELVLDELNSNHYQVDHAVEALQNALQTPSEALRKELVDNRIKLNTIRVELGLPFNFDMRNISRSLKTLGFAPKKTTLERYWYKK